MPGKFLSLHLHAPFSQLPKTLKIQHGGYDLTTNRKRGWAIANRNSGFCAPPENACIAG